MAWLEALNLHIGRISLAPIKYRDLMVQNPVIQQIRVSSFTNLWGQEMFQATAYLHQTCRRHKPAAQSIYGDADGTGTSEARNTAIFKAISESLERWAYWEFTRSHHRQELGFNLDPTSTGLAAYPGINSRWARRLAMNEAYERWALVQWWQGDLGACQFEHSKVPRHKGLSFWRILVDGLFVLIASYEFLGPQSTDSVYAYGFAADQDLVTAASHAMIELERNVHVLKAHFAQANPPQPILPTEARLLYFASPQGYQEFRSRLSGKKSRTLPPLVFDGEVVGPWRNYTVVWRALPRGTYADSGFLF